MRRLLTVLFAVVGGILLAIVSQTSAQAAGGTISGTVTDEQSGLPIAGVSVYLYTANYGWGGSAYTDSNGEFTTSALPPGDYRVQYTAPSQSPNLSEWYNNKTSFGAADPITITDANRTADAQLARGSRFQGTITAEDTGNPLPSASVTVYSANDNSTVAYVNADQSGVFSTSALPPGSYKLQFNAPSQSRYLSEWHENKGSYGAADPLQLADSDMTVDAALTKGLQISGTITAEDSGDPLPYANVSVYDAGSGGYPSLASGYTDQKGKFTTSALPPGTYKVQYSAPNQSEYLGEWYEDKNSFATADPLELTDSDVSADAILAKGHRFVGRVTAADTGSGLSNVNVTVYAENGSGYSTVGYGYTDQNGNFATSALPPGTYKLQYGAQGAYMGEWYDDQTSLGTATPLQLTNADVPADATLDKGLRITGQVTAEGSGNPVAGSYVSVYSTSNGMYMPVGYGQTDMNGNYATGALPPGDYKVQFNAPYQSSFFGEWYDDKPDYATADPVTLTTTDGVADAVLAKGVRITGRVTAEDTDSGISSVSVSVYKKNGNGYSSVASGYTDQSGYYTTGAVLPGEYKIQYNTYQSAYLGEWHDDKADFVSADPIEIGDADKTVNAALARGARAVGKVTNSAGVPIPNVAVYISGDNGLYSGTQTNGNGDYASSALPSGDYKIGFRPSGTSYVEEWFDNKPNWSAADPVSLTRGQDTTTDVVLANASHIVGTVTDADGNPVNAVVRAYGSDTSASDSTALDGSYDIGGLREGSYRLQIVPTEPSALISEWWNGQRDEFDADPIQLGVDDSFTADVTLDDGAAITGTAVDDQGNPVEGVIVRATDAESEKTVTAADGSYRLEGLEPGQYRVRFKPQANLALQWFDGAASENDATVLTLETGQTVSDIDARLRGSRTITGTVTDPQGNPVKDVRVEVYRDGSSYCADRVWTDAQGAFQTGDLPMGSYRVYLRPSAAAQLASQWYDQSATRGGGTPVRVTDGQAASIVAELQTGGTISGTVLGSGGAPVANASVSAEGAGDFRSTTTDANGHYEISGLVAGDYAVAFSAKSSGYLSEWFDDKASAETANPVSVGLGQTTSGIDAQLTKGGSISGTMFTAAGYSLSYQEIELYLGDDDVAWTQTNMDGTFTFSGLRPGSYTMYAPRTGEWLGQWWDNKPDRASADRIGVAPGQALTGKDFTLQRAASIAGTVTGSDGTLIDGFVEVTDADGNELAWADIENGSYEVVGLTAGTYYAEFRSYGGDWLREWWNDKPALDQATPITVSNGQALTGVDVTLAKGSSIRGKVLNGKGNPVPTCVTVYVGMTDVEAGEECTNGAGEYRVGGLPAGNYQVLFQPYSGAYAKQWWDGQARRSTAEPVTLEAASQAVADATLLKGGTLTGVVTDEQAKPVGGVQVRAYASEDEYPRAAVTDGQGRYTLMGLDDEDYRVQAVPGSSRLDLMSEWYEDRSSFGNADVVPVPNGATRTASFTLDKGATISGTVTDDKDQPVAGIGVDVFDLDGKKALTVWTDPDGNYESTALKEGEYKVRFMPGYYGGEGLVEQWWNNKATEAKANIVLLGPKEQKTGVNAKLRPVGSANPPGAPSGVVVSPGDSEVAVSWQAPVDDGGLPVTRYVVQGAPSGECETFGELSCTVKGLDNGESYSFSVRAVTSAGSSEASAPSAAVVPFGVPKPPTDVTAVAGQESASVSWTPGASNGRPISGYTVTAAPGGGSCVTAGTQCTVTGLSGGTSYTFTVKAKNVAGESSASQPSAPVTPSSPPVPPPPVQPPVNPDPAPAGPDTTPQVTPALPAPPKQLKVSVKKGTAKASWAKVLGATGYEVRVSPAKGKKKSWKKSSKTTFTSSKLKKGSYILEVRALGAGGASGTVTKRFKVK